MPDAGPQFPFINPTSDNVSGYLDLQRKQQLAQMLMGAAQQSASTPADWNSMRVVPKRSPLSNVASLATALMAGKTMNELPAAQAKYYQGLMGGGQAPSSAAQPPQEAPNVPPPMIRSPDYQPPQQASSGPPLQGPQGSMLLPGTSAQQSQMLLQMMGPGEYGKAIAGQYAPTDLEKTLRAAGIPQNQWGPILQANITKQNYIAPTSVRPGSVALGPDGQPKFYNPAAPEGSMPQFGPNGFPTSIVPIPGGAQATAMAAAEKTAGTISQTPQRVGTDAQGQDVFKFLQPPALGGTTAGAPGAGPSGGILAPTTASPATVQSQKSGAEAGQAYASELAKNATGATEVRRSLSELKNLAGQATPGAMNEGKMKLGSYMIAAGVSPQTAAQWLGVDVGALQAAQKQTATLAVNTIHSMTSRGTNFDLDTFMRNNPNLNMSDPSAFQKVVDYMDNKSKQEIAKQKDFVQWKKGVSPDEWESGHTAHWLEEQNQQIDAGRSNSRPPLSSFLRGP